MGQSFDELIFHCIDSGLLILGESGKHVVFWKWETENNLKKEDIPSHIPKFKEFLDEMFGSGGSLVQASIARDVAIKFGLGERETDLSEAIQMAREHFSE